MCIRDSNKLYPEAAKKASEKMLGLARAVPKIALHYKVSGIGRFRLPIRAKLGCAHPCDTLLSDVYSRQRPRQCRHPGAPGGRSAGRAFARWPGGARTDSPVAQDRAAR